MKQRESVNRKAKPKSGGKTVKPGPAVRGKRTPEAGVAERELTWNDLPDDVRAILEMRVDGLVDDFLRIAVRPGTRIRLGLLKYERDLILRTGTISMGLSEVHAATLESAKYPELNLTLSEWDELLGFVVAETNAGTDKRKEQRLHILAEKIDLILRRHRESSTRPHGSRWNQARLKV